MTRKKLLPVVVGSLIAAQCAHADVELIAVGRISGEQNLAPKAVGKTLFLDVVAALNAKGISSDDIPARMEGLAFGRGMHRGHGEDGDRFAGEGRPGDLERF